MKKSIASGIVAAVTLLAAHGARADVAAVYAEGHGGMETANAAAPGLGFQLGARLLIFEGYLDHTSFGGGESVSRGIIGLRAGVGSHDLRLVLRGGLGGIEEQGGALTGHVAGTPDRRGAVARAGLALESRVARPLLAGFGIDGEAFALSDGGGGPLGMSAATSGSDVFASLRLIFELGI
jgi:hypothetical protein